MIINEVDNRDYIQQYLNTVDFQKNDYCQILVIRRKKDAGNEQVSQHVKTIKCYLVNKENFKQNVDEALKIARTFNARVYINPSPKNLKDVNYHLALEFMNEQYFGNFSNPYAKVNSVFAQVPGKSATRILMFDVDDNAITCTFDFIKYYQSLGFTVEWEHHVDSDSFYRDFYRLTITW